MVARAKLVCRKKSSPAWHADFLKMVPTIETYARMAFKHLNRDARREAVQDVVCNACCAYARLVELGKVELAYPTVLARYAILQFCDGRRTGNRLNACDITSEYCRLRTGVNVQRLDRFNPAEDAWEQLVVEDRHVGPAEVTVIRLDFKAFLRALPAKLRKVARVLLTGETTGATARKFHVSPGRISQIRKELFLAWYRFQGEELAAAVA
jgi:hypothetical protein